MLKSVVSVGAVVFAASGAMAVVNPFTESFDSSAAAWSSAATMTEMIHVASGGVGNTGYATNNGVTFTGLAVGAQPILARAQSNFNSSGNQFFGNWITAGVAQLSVSVRHNAGVPVTYFVRFAPAAGPGAVAVIPGVVQPNTWTSIDLAITPATSFIYEGTSFLVAFSDVSRIQVGVLVDGALAGQAGPFAFDVDGVTITPAPGALGLLGLGGLVAARRKR